MKNMQKFAAQQLTKNEMNEVKGGYVTCTLYDSNGSVLSEGRALGDSNLLAEGMLNEMYGEYGWYARCIGGTDIQRDGTYMDHIA